MHCTHSCTQPGATVPCIKINRISHVTTQYLIQSAWSFILPKQARKSWEIRASGLLQFLYKDNIRSVRPTQLSNASLRCQGAFSLRRTLFEALSLHIQYYFTFRPHRSSRLITADTWWTWLKDVSSCKRERSEWSYPTLLGTSRIFANLIVNGLLVASSVFVATKTYLLVGAAPPSPFALDCAALSAECDFLPSTLNFLSWQMS